MKLRIPLPSVTVFLGQTRIVKMVDSEKEKKALPIAPSSVPLPAAASADSMSGFSSLLVFVILGLAWFVGFASRLFAIVRFESIIHEFDPWQVMDVKGKENNLFLYTGSIIAQLIIW
jgi:hypothetical protein